MFHVFVQREAPLHTSLLMADTHHYFNEKHETDIFWYTLTIFLFAYLRGVSTCDQYSSTDATQLTADSLHFGY